MFLAIFALQFINVTAQFWGDDNVGITSHETFFHQDVPLLGGTI
jgi:hypothetical protein